jgi:hypothetical protein
MKQSAPLVWTAWVARIKEGTVCCSCAVLRWKLTRRIACWKAKEVRFLGSEIREEVQMLGYLTGLRLVSDTRERVRYLGADRGQD